MDEETYPDTIYVTRENDGDTSYLSVYEDVDFADETCEVAVYQRVRVSEIVVTKTETTRELK